MSGDVFNVSGAKTQRSLFDGSRPAPMLEADKIYNKFRGQIGANSFYASELTYAIGQIIQETKFYDLENENEESRFWSNVEQALNNGREIKTKGDLPIEKFEVALSFFYSALDTIDSENAISDLAFLRTSYFETINYVSSRISSHQSPRHERLIERIATVIEAKMDKMVKRMNKMVDDGQLNAQKIS